MITDQFSLAATRLPPLNVVASEDETTLYAQYHNIPDVLEALSIALASDQPSSEAEIEEYVITWLSNLNSLVSRFYRYNVLSYAHTVDSGSPSEICHQVVFSSMPANSKSDMCPHLISKVAAALPTINLYSISGKVDRLSGTGALSEAQQVLQENSKVVHSPHGGLVLRPLAAHPIIPYISSAGTAAVADVTASWPKHRFMPVFATPPNDQYINHMKAPTLLNNGQVPGKSRVKALKEFVDQARALIKMQETPPPPTAPVVAPSHPSITRDAFSPPGGSGTNLPSGSEAFSHCGSGAFGNDAFVPSAIDLLDLAVERETDVDMKELLLLVRRLRTGDSVGADSSMSVTMPSLKSIVLEHEIPSSSPSQSPPTNTADMMLKRSRRRAAVELMRHFLEGGEKDSEPFTPQRRRKGSSKSLKETSFSRTKSNPSSGGGSRGAPGLLASTRENSMMNNGGGTAGGCATTTAGTKGPPGIGPRTRSLVRGTGTAFMGGIDNSSSRGDATEDGSPILPPVTRDRRIGVSEPRMETADIKQLVLEDVPKEPHEEEEVRKCVNKSTLFAAFEDHEREKVVRVMSPQNFPAGFEVLAQGQPGNDTFYLVISGQVEITKDKKVLCDLGPGEYFGELELMHAQTCAASVKCITPVSTYSLSKEVYRHIVLNATLERRKMFLDQINNVDFFVGLPPYDKTKLAEALCKKTFAKGEYLIRRGEIVQNMFMVLSGQVKVVGRDKVTGGPVDIIELGRGDVIGELEFLFEHPAVADVVAGDIHVEVARLQKQHFDLLMPEDVVASLKATVNQEKYDHYIANADEHIRRDIQRAEHTLDLKKTRSEAMNNNSSNKNPLALVAAEAVESVNWDDEQRENQLFQMASRQHGAPHFDQDGELIFNINGNDPMRASSSISNLVRDVVARFPAVAFASQGQAVVCLQEDGTVLYWNPLIADLTQYDPTDAVSHSIFSFITNEAHQREVRDMLKEAQNCVGDWAAFCESKYFTPRTIELTQASGLFKVQLSVQIIPPCTPQPMSAPEVFLLIGREKKRKAPSAALDQIGLITDSIKPSFASLLQDVKNLVPEEDFESEASVRDKDRSIVMNVPAHALHSLRSRFRECQQLISQLTPLAGLGDVAEAWHPVRIEVLMNRFITQLSEAVNKRHNQLNVVIGELIPSDADVFLDALQVSHVIGYLATNCNRYMKHGTITISVDVVDVFGKRVGDVDKKADSATNRRSQDGTAVVDVTELQGILASRSGGSSSPDGSTFVLGGQRGSLELVNNQLASFLAPTPVHSSRDIISLASEHHSNAPSLAHKLLRFTVSDTGPGISKDFMAEIKKTLQKSSIDVTAAIGGKDNKKASKSDSKAHRKGLGLLQVVNTVKEMAGTFNINTVEAGTAKDGEAGLPEQHGTTFQITIPLVIADKASSGPNEGLNDAVHDKDARNFTTVLVENSAIHRNAICQLLWGRRHAVIPANTWKDLLRLLHEGTCDMLIIDPDSLEDFDDGVSLLAAQRSLLSGGVGSLNDDIPDSPKNHVPAHHIPNPMEVLAGYANKIAVVVTSENFADTSQAGVMNNGVTALPKPCPQALLHYVVQQAEHKMRTIREDATKIAKLREKFSVTHRGEVKTLRLLGRGAFGEVHEVEDILTRGKMAMKTLTIRNQITADETMHEIQAMTTLKHENIVHYFYCQKVDETKLKIFMELAAGGSIADTIKEVNNGAGLPISMITQYLRDILAGLVYIHSLGYVHCDLKPANILLDADGRCKIGDFGTACQLRPGEQQFTMKGTPQYMAPEVISADATEEHGYGVQADIWSLGVTVMEMATGKVPFSHIDGAKGMGVMKYVSDVSERGEQVDLSPLFGSSPLIFEFVKECLDPNPEKRPTAESLLSYGLVCEGGSGQQANKLLRRARLLHILNQFVAFQDPDEEVESEYSSATGDSITNDDSGENGFFDSSDESDDPDAESSSPSKNETSPERSIPGYNPSGSMAVDSTSANSKTAGNATTAPHLLSKRAVANLAKNTDFFDSGSDDDDEPEEEASTGTVQNIVTNSASSSPPFGHIVLMGASSSSNQRPSTMAENPLSHYDNTHPTVTPCSKTATPTTTPNITHGLPPSDGSSTTSPTLRQAVINIIGVEDSAGDDSENSVLNDILSHPSPTATPVVIPVSDLRVGTRKVSEDGPNILSEYSPATSPRAHQQSSVRRSPSNLLHRRLQRSPSGYSRNSSMRRQQKQQQMAEEYNSVFQRSISVTMEDGECDDSRKSFGDSGHSLRGSFNNLKTGGGGGGPLPEISGEFAFLKRTAIRTPEPGNRE